MAKVSCPLNEAAESYRESPAVIAPDKAISYGEYHNLVSATAERLTAFGVAEQERIALFLPNDWRYVVLLMALCQVRAIACPLNTRTPAQGLQPLLEQVGCKKLVADPRQPGRETLGQVKVFDPKALVETEQPRKNSEAEIDLEQPATIVFTSGSLGAPKAVLHSYGNHYYNAKGSNENIPLHPGDRWLLALPLYHVGGIGILFRCLLSGAAVVIPDKEQDLLESVQQYGITHLSLVPTQLYRLLRNRNSKAFYGTLRAILLGGAAAAANLIDRGWAYKLPLHTSYGLTEMGSQVTTTAADTPQAKRFTSGKILPHRELSVASSGEILVRGKTLFQGYLEREGLTRPLDNHGWFATGDLGKLDSDGYLTVTGRKDNMFISGGENIQPEEIETALCEHPSVTQAVVVPAPDEEFGSRPVVFVQMRDKPLDAKKLITFLTQRLARYKIPIAFYDWPESAGTEEMKFSREFFRKLAAQKVGSNRGA